MLTDKALIESLTKFTAIFMFLMSAGCGRHVELSWFQNLTLYIRASVYQTSQSAIITKYSKCRRFTPTLKLKHKCQLSKFLSHLRSLLLSQIFKTAPEFSKVV